MGASKFICIPDDDFVPPVEVLHQALHFGPSDVVSITDVILDPLKKKDMEKESATKLTRQSLFRAKNKRNIPTYLHKHSVASHF